MKHIIGDLLEAHNPDKQIEKAKETFNVNEPTNEQIRKVSQQLINEACNPFDNPNLRNTIAEIKEEVSR